MYVWPWQVIGGSLQVSLSAFAFLFSELVQYNQTQVDNIAELERRWSLYFQNTIDQNLIYISTHRCNYVLITRLSLPPLYIKLRYPIIWWILIWRVSRLGLLSEQVWESEKKGPFFHKVWDNCVYYICLVLKITMLCIQLTFTFHSLI